MQKLVSLIRSHWFIFAFISVALGDCHKKTFVWLIPEYVLPRFFSRSCCLIFKFLSHYDLTFVQGVSVFSSFIDLYEAV